MSDECIACVHASVCKYSETYTKDLRALKKINDHRESAATIITVACKFFEEANGHADRTFLEVKLESNISKLRSSGFI